MQAFSTSSSGGQPEKRKRAEMRVNIFLMFKFFVVMKEKEMSTENKQVRAPKTFLPKLVPACVILGLHEILPTIP